MDVLVVVKNKTKKKCHSCEYSIDVRNVKFELPYRTYIWEGAAEVPENPATSELEYKASGALSMVRKSRTLGSYLKKLRLMQSVQR
jgi:hypothetical protein